MANSVIQRLQIEITKLSIENDDLKARSSLFRREHDTVVVEKERLLKLVDQLKNEKSHLVETVMQLSNEMDTAHIMIHPPRRGLGLILIALLEARGVEMDDPFMRDILREMHTDEHTNGSTDSTTCELGSINVIPSKTDTKLPPVPSVVTTCTPSSNSGASAADHVRSLQRLDAEALEANEAIYRHQMLEGGLGTGHSIPSPTRNGLTSNRSRSRNGSIKSGNSRRRRKQTLDRDETESIVSSVSTHRSGRTNGSMSSWINRKQKSSKITAENLAILNRMNDGESDNNIHSNAQPNPATSHDRKNAAEDGFWWPTLF